jgi:hypothetical protein
VLYTNLVLLLCFGGVVMLVVTLPIPWLAAPLLHEQPASTSLTALTTARCSTFDHHPLRPWTTHEPATAAACVFVALVAEACWRCCCLLLVLYAGCPACCYSLLLLWFEDSLDLHASSCVRFNQHASIDSYN